MTIDLEGRRQFWSPCANGDPPDNDDFANRLVITGASGTVDGIYVGCATTEVGEPTGSAVIQPPCHQTIWYEWTAPANGTATIDTLNSTCPADIHSFFTVDGNLMLDTTLTVWTGATLGALVEVASNDDQDFPVSNNMWSEVIFAATSGTVYKIQAGTGGRLFTAGGGQTNYAGIIVLNWSLV